MAKKFERFLSTLLIILIMLVFLSTILPRFVDIQTDAIVHIWNISFIASWILLLVYGIYILFQKNSRGFSIFTAIVSALAFVSLSIHAIAATSAYLSFLPKQIIVSSKLLIFNGQVVFYTSLLVVYILHVINLLIMGKYNKSEDNLTIEEKDTQDIIL